jgi:hypothetical protein
MKESSKPILCTFGLCSFVQADRPGRLVGERQQQLRSAGRADPLQAAPETALVQQGAVCAGVCRLLRGAGESLEVSLPVLQEWRR